MSTPLISIVVLTYNRPDELARCLRDLDELDASDIEIIVVDNASESDTKAVMADHPRARLIPLHENKGASGRNAGMEAASGELVVSLDDDVCGLRRRHLIALQQKFSEDSELVAINFRVVDDVTGDQINWAHHNRIEDYADNEFSTYEITEGAVAFRRSALEATDLYPEEFFISHEGPDLAIQLMNQGGYLIYSPDVTVRHAHAEAGRPSWRRYYYDTRNLIWLGCRRYPLFLGCRRLMTELGGMFFYAVRDGFLRYWLKGIWDGVKGVRHHLAKRTGMTKSAYQLYRRIEREHPGFWYRVRRRLFQKGVHTC